jgi:ferric-dicitrate binding protein FerR (iron transport regulator)
MMNTLKERIKRFVSDKFSFNDYLIISSSFRNQDNNDEFRKDLEQEWEETDMLKYNKKNLDSVLDRLHHNINLRKINEVTQLQKFIGIFSKVAAVLMIPALLTILLLSYKVTKKGVNKESWAEIHSPVGSTMKFQLSDGTVVWLNSGSTLKYPSIFTRHRTVKVTGELWFDVAKIKNSDFRVVTPYIDVKVTGTRFNIIAYEKEPSAEVILEEGKVVVLGKDNNFKKELQPNQQLTFNKETKEIRLSDIDSKLYTSWKDGYMVFKNEPMWLIAKRFERRYNTEIILHGDSLKNSVFRATFHDESLEEICRMLASVGPVKYRIHPRDKLQDDTFSKSRIEMWLK